MVNRVVFTGPSGTGKTTWARHIESKFGIPYINLQGSMLWEKYGIKSHREVILRSHSEPHWGFDYVMELMTAREKAYLEHERFVSDRSSIDNLVYALLDLSSILGQSSTDELMLFALKMHKMIDVTIYLPFTGDLYTEEDPKRILNPHYQLVTDAVFEKTITEFFAPNWDALIVAIQSSDRDERSLAIDEIFESFKPKSLILSL